MNLTFNKHLQVGSLLVLTLLAGVVGCHGPRQRGPIHKGCCPNHGKGGCDGIKNADYYEPRGQSPEGETVVGPETIDAHTQGSVLQSRPPASAPLGDQTSDRSGVARLGSFKTSQRAVPGRPQRDARVSPISFTPVEARRDISENGQILAGPDESWMTGTDAQRYPDEYLFDGGDRDLPVRYDDYARRGLDTEDTVGESSDRTGRRRPVKSNQVAIYAPRFAAVRSVTTPSGQNSVNHVASAEDVRRDSGMRTKIGPQRYAHNEGPQGIQTRLRVSGIESRSGVRGVGQVARLTEHKTDVKGKESFAFAFRGQINSAQEAYLAAGLDAALNWTQGVGAVIAAKTESLQIVRATSRDAEYVGVEDPYKKPGQLRILKVADKKQARPGDVITFVLRFENVGDLELYDVRIVDNLTPRLEFIDESATCDLPGEVILEDNEEGSLVLNFKLDNPLPGTRAVTLKENKDKGLKTGGTISFQCRVR